MTQTSRLVLEIDSRDAEQKAADTRKALEALEGAGLRVKPAMDKAGSGMESAGKSADAAGKSFSSQRDEIEQLLGSINPLTRKMNELEKQELALAKAHKAGKIETDTYTEYQQKITETRNELTRFSDSLTRTGNTAKQTAAALRGVPAQFTDIAVSLQGGQAPLTVFLQQGGQLKDMFGGAGPAAKALGGYVLGLVNPFTVAAAAAATLGVAYYQGSKEQDAFRDSLIITGNAAGTSTGALAEMAKRIGDTTGTTGTAAAALAQLAGTGKIASTSFEAVAAAAVSFEKATGQAVSTTVGEFVKLADDPVKALASLNEKYNFLTASVYEQVRAAQEMGDKEAAAAIAQEALAKALSERAGKIKESLGYIETAWNTVAGAAKKGWDAMLGIGRESTLESKLSLLQERLDNVNKLTAAGRSSRASRGGESAEDLQKQIAAIQGQINAKNDQSAAEGKAAQLQRDGQQAYEAFQKSIEQNFTKRQKMNKALEDDEKRINAARAAGYIISEEQAAASQKAIRDNPIYKESAPKKEKAYTEDAGMKALDAARQTQAVLLQQNASLNAQGIATEKVGTQAQALIRWEQQLADIKGKKTLTADQKSLLASQDLITAQLKKNVALEREAQISRDIQQAQKDQVQLLTLTGQLREANSLKSSLDDAAQMAEYERQGNTEAMKRLETLIKIRDVNLKASQKPGTIEGVSQAPQVTGIDASVGGAYSEIQRLNEESAKVDAWRTMELEKQKAYLDLKAINEETYAERVNNINQQGRDNQAKIERAKNSAVLTSSADFFGNMTALSQSGNKKLAAVGKAAAIAQATIQGYVAVQNALAVQPYPLGMALAVSAGVAAAANVAAIAGIGFSGGGYTGPGGVNEVAGTVHKGEVVWSQKDIQRYGGVAAVEALRNGNVSAIPSAPPAQGGGQMSPMSSAPPQIHITVNGDGSSGSANATAGYEQMGQAVLATVRAEMPKVARAVIQQEKGQNGLLDPSNRRNAA